MKKIYFRKGYKYQLSREYRQYIDIRPDKEIITEFIRLSVDGFISINRGYAWDGPSVAIDTRSFMRGSLVHDAIYQLIRMGLLPFRCWEQADDELKKICLDDKMFKFRAWYVHKTLNIAGGEAAKPKNKKEEYVAP